MRQIFHTDRAPGAVGPYSQAVKSGGLLWVSGQIPLDPAGGEIVEGDVSAQTHQVLKNLKAILEGAGSGLSRVVKVTVYLTDMSDFAAVNTVYAEYFGEAPPARACVEVSALPKGVAVEIEAVAEAV